LPFGKMKKTFSKPIIKNMSSDLTKLTTEQIKNLLKSSGHKGTDAIFETSPANLNYTSLGQVKYDLKYKDETLDDGYGIGHATIHICAESGHIVASI